MLYIHHEPQEKQQIRQSASTITLVPVWVSALNEKKLRKSDWNRHQSRLGG